MAQGLARDRLACLRNIEHLLQSPKIGPKAIAQVVEEMRRVSNPPGDALVALVELLGSRHADVDGMDLLSFAREHGTVLAETIEQAAKSDMGAKARLRLEAGIKRHVRELESLWELIDLLDRAAASSTTELYLNDLVLGGLTKYTPAFPGQTGVVHVCLSPAKDGSTVVTDARALVPLMATTLGLLVGSETKALRVDASLGASGEAILVCEPSQVDSPVFVPCLLPRVIEPTLTVVRRAASWVGVLLSFDTDASRTTLVIPPRNVGQRAAGAATTEEVS